MSRALRERDETCLALPDELGHSPDTFLDWHVRIDPGHTKDVERFDAEIFQTLFAGLTQITRITAADPRSGLDRRRSGVPPAIRGQREAGGVRHRVGPHAAVGHDPSGSRWSRVGQWRADQQTVWSPILLAGNGRYPRQSTCCRATGSARRTIGASPSGLAPIGRLVHVISRGIPAHPRDMREPHLQKGTAAGLRDAGVRDGRSRMGGYPIASSANSER